MANGDNGLIRAGDMPVYLAREVGDMRYGMPGIKGIIEEGGHDPNRGIYVFVNRAFTRVKLFYWDVNGYCVWYKHVPVGGGMFQVEHRGNGYRKITAVNLKELLRRERAPKALPVPAPKKKAA